MISELTDMVEFINQDGVQIMNVHVFIVISLYRIDVKLWYNYGIKFKPANSHNALFFVMN